MTKILKRDTVHGPEWIFRWNGQLYVFKDKESAIYEYSKLSGETLF